MTDTIASLLRARRGAAKPERQVAFDMPRAAVLLMDLQTDFLGGAKASMPVDGPDSERIIATANAVLGGHVLQDALQILVVNQFPTSERVANFFRHNAALASSPGAGLDARIQASSSATIISKSKASAFSNPDLDALLRANAVQDVYILGVFAEGCVRATAVEAKRRGYNVTVPSDAIGSNANLKRAFASWAMRRAGVTLVPSLIASEDET